MVTASNRLTSLLVRIKCSIARGVIIISWILFLINIHQPNLLTARINLDRSLIHCRDGLFMWLLCWHLFVWTSSRYFYPPLVQYNSVNDVIVIELVCIIVWCIIIPSHVSHHVLKQFLSIYQSRLHCTRYETSSLWSYSNNEKKHS